MQPFRLAAFALFLFFVRAGSAQVSLTSSANPSLAAQPVTLTATVTGTAGTPTGSVEFRDGAALLGSATLDSAGRATLTIPKGFADGAHTITAVYTGDSKNPPATSTPLVQRVNKAGTSTALSETVSRSGFALRAVVAGPADLGLNPSGTVQFVDMTGDRILGAAGVSGGVATLAVGAPMPVGHMVQARYSGDDFFALSSGAQMFLGLTDSFSYRTLFVPDMIASVFGSNFTGSIVTPPGTTLPATLGGVTVTVMDAGGASHRAGLYFVAPGQINLVIPSDTPAGAARLVITAGTATFNMGITIGTVAPSVATGDASGSGTAAAQVIRVHPDGTQEGPLSIDSAPISFGAAGDRLFLVLFGTGFRHAAAPVSCTMNGRTLPALYAGAQNTYEGLDQVNLEVPAGTSGLQTVTCRADTEVTNATTLTIQ